MSSGWFAGMAVAVASLMLTGCAGGGSADLRTASQKSRVESTEAFVMPAPGGPSIVAVLQERHGNALAQKIVLSTNARTPGQNKLEVSLFGPVDTSDVPELASRSISRSVISSKLREEFPGVDMNLSASFLQNKYGPFGYAIGRSSLGDTCIYGWQRISEVDGDTGLFTPRGAIDIRLRMCDATASEAELLQVIYGYTVNAYFATRNWNPFGSPPAVDPGLGRVSSPIQPILTPEVVQAPQPAVVVAPRRTPIRRPAAEPEPDRRYEDYPAVPPAAVSR